ncbi:hypothetical protein Vafri_15597, partial [Volvox africanus]
YAAALSSPSLTATAKHLALIRESNSARPESLQVEELSTSSCTATSGGGVSTVEADCGFGHPSALVLNYSTGMKADLPATSSLIRKLRIRGGGLTGAHSGGRAESETGIAPQGQGGEEDD